jgi:8-oxo-dGTP diphosphatase
MYSQTDSVRIVVWDTKKPDHFVALTEVDDPDNIKLPGGKFEAGESPDEAAIRELREELGVSAEEVNLVFAKELVNDDGSSRRYIYQGKADLSTLKPTEEVDHFVELTVETVPEGQNRNHIMSAVAATTPETTS